jgi:hypothetical protein
MTKHLPPPAEPEASNPVDMPKIQIISAPKVPTIQQAMLQVARAMEKAGIAKLSETKAAGKYKYRGIDAALNSLSRPLVDAQIVVSPSYRLISTTEVKTKEGVGYLTTVEGSITFVGPNSDMMTCGPFIGQAFDSMDKGATKAMSVAYRTGMFLTFVIPLGPGHDTEETGNELDDSATGWLELISGAEDQATLTKIAGSLKEDKEVSPAGLKAARAAWAAKSKELKNG